MLSTIYSVYTYIVDLHAYLCSSAFSGASMHASSHACSLYLSPVYVGDAEGASSGVAQLIQSTQAHSY